MPEMCARVVPHDQPIPVYAGAPRQHLSPAELESRLWRIPGTADFLAVAAHVDHPRGELVPTRPDLGTYAIPSWKCDGLNEKPIVFLCSPRSVLPILSFFIQSPFPVLSSGSQEAGARASAETRKKILDIHPPAALHRIPRWLRPAIRAHYTQHNGRFPQRKEEGTREVNKI